MSLDLFWQNWLAFFFQAGLVGMAGLLLPRLFRLRNPRAELGWCRTLLVLLFLLPFLQPWRPLERISQVPSVAAEFALPAAPMEPVARVAPQLDWRLPLLWLLGAGSFICLARLVLGLAALHRLTKRAQPCAVEAEWADLLTATPRPLRLYLAPGLQSPQTFGWLRPAVFLPLDFSTRSAQERAAMLAHEVAHIQRGDWAWLLLEESLRSLLWFHPAVWLLLERAALCREQAADLRAVELTGDRSRYVETLYSLAAERFGQGIAASVPFLSRGHLTRRVALLMKEVEMESKKIRWMLPVAGVAALAVTVAGVWLFPLTAPAQAQVASPDCGFVVTVAEAVALEDQCRVTVRVSDILRQEVITVPTVLALYGGSAEISSSRTYHRDDTTPDKSPVFGLKVLPAKDRSTAELIFWREDGGKRSCEQRQTLNLSAPKPQVELPEEFLKQVAAGGKPAIPPGYRPMQPSGCPDLPEGATNPVELHRENPDYPPEHAKAGKEGRVVLQVLIGEEGTVLDATVIKSADPLFDKSALDAVKKWTFQPSTLNGQPLRCCWMIVLKFVPPK